MCANIYFTNLNLIVLWGWGGFLTRTFISLFIQTLSTSLYQFNLINQKCMFCPGLYDKNDETCTKSWPGMSGERESDEDKQWVFLKKVESGSLKQIKERIYDTGTSSLNGLNVNVILQNSFFDSTSGISRLEHTKGLFYIDPEAFSNMGLDQVVLPTEFCEDYSAL